MTQTDVATATWTTGGGATAWIFRILLIAGAAFMVYSWLQPWWLGDVAVIKGEDNLVLHPWGVDAAAQVRANIDESVFQMPFPSVFAGFMWVYLAVCMLAILASLFINRKISIGRFNISISMLLILFVGLSYMAVVGLALGIGILKATAAGANFIGKSNVLEPGSGAKLKMVSYLVTGYWLALGAGGALTVLGLIRPLFIRKPKA